MENIFSSLYKSIDEDTNESDLKTTIKQYIDSIIDNDKLWQSYEDGMIMVAKKFNISIKQAKLIYAEYWKEYQKSQEKLYGGTKGVEFFRKAIRRLEQVPTDSNDASLLDSTPESKKKVV